MTGGYSLIDCFDVNITSEPVKIEGIFKKYQMSKRKAFLLSNVTISNKQLNDVFSTPYFEDGKVCFPAYDGVIKISDTDYVTFESTADVIADKYLSKEEFLTIDSDNAPYVSRSARDGIVKLNLVGGTVAWNQLVQNGNFADGTDNWTSRQSNALSVSDGIATLTSKVISANNQVYQPINILKDHCYLIAVKAKKTGNYDNLLIRGIKDDTSYTFIRFQLSTEYKNYIGIFKAVNDTDDLRVAMPSGTTVGDTLDFTDVYLTDITLMFNTTIADYVYSLEQATEGSGIAWLKSYGFLTKDYYDYDAGSLQSVCTSGRKITALDGTVRTYPIDNEELRGLFKLDSNNKLYANGDIYPSSGSGRRKYGIVNLGELDYTYVSGANSRMATTIQNAKDIDNNIVANLITPKYLADTKNNIYAHSKDKTIGIGPNGSCWIYDTSYTDAEIFKTAMSGQYLVYELAEETTFSADPYINPQRSEGTEEFVDGLTRDVMIPVGNESTYYKDELFNIIGEYIDSCDDAIIAMIPEGE